MYATDGADLLQAVFHPGEVAQAFADLFFLDTGNVGRNTGSEGVVDVVLTRQTEALLFHVERFGLLNLVLDLLDVTDDAFLLQFGKRILDGLDVVFLQFGLDDGVVGPVDEGITVGLVLDDTHLGIYIVLHLEVVTVQMVGGDVQQDSDIGPEIIHVVELERTEFDDIVCVRILSHLQSQGVTDVASKSGIIARILEDMVDE